MSDQAEEIRRRLEARSNGLPVPPAPIPKEPPAFQPSPVPHPVVRPIPKSTVPKNACICPNCNSIEKPRRITRGSIWIEIVLWIAFLVPGLIYSIWRLTTRYMACPRCLAANPIPLNTPRGRKLLEEYQRGL
ncbi:MAG: hypothetical protein RKO24_11515 [Candidatus Competibacter sp.]|nr:hypothetical protein [Candidatus Competibacter sp.]